MLSMISGRRLLVLFFFALSAAIGGQARGIVQSFGLAGTPAPGGPAGAQFAGALDPTLNDAGQIVFFGVFTQGIAGVSADDDTALWTNVSGPLDLLVREGQSPPGLVGAKFAQPSLKYFADDGRVLFLGRLQIGFGGITSDSEWAWWWYDNGQITPFWRAGDFAPDTSGGSVFQDAFLRVAPSGGIALLGSLKQGIGGVTSVDDYGIWSNDSGDLRLVVREGNSAPGLPAGAVFNQLSSRISLNNTGDIVFWASLVPNFGGVTASNDVGLWKRHNGQLSLIYREGDAPPGTPAGAKYTDFIRHLMDNSGRLVFQADLLVGQGGVTSSNNSGIWQETESGTQLIARTGSAAPGAAGVSFAGLDLKRVNSHGAVLFYASVNGPQPSDRLEDSLWSSGFGTLLQVMRKDDIAPGASLGVTFKNTLGLALLNEQGQVAFGAQLQGTGITTANDYGIWAQDISGNLRAIAIEGQMVDLGAGDVRQLKTILQTFSFNNRGELAFEAGFLDGTYAVLVSSLVAVHHGDFDVNGLVDAADYQLWRSTFGNTAGDMRADGNQNGVVDAADYVIWRNDLGSPATSVLVIVPEPPAHGIVLLGALIACLACETRRGRITTTR